MYMPFWHPYWITLVRLYTF